jgi:ATP-dependent Lon protease
MLTMLKNIKEGLEGHAVDWYHDVFGIVFPDVDAKAVNGLWKEQLKEPSSSSSGRKKKEKERKKKESDDDESGDDDDD